VLPISLEILFRLYLAFEVGPSVLLRHGMVLDWSHPSARQLQLPPSLEDFRGTYAKYSPNFTRFGHDEKGRFAYTINSDGFRGREIAAVKPPNTFRIVTLGASSTFCFGVRDEEAYPHLLEKILNESPCDRELDFEVINLGMPHLRTRHIAELYAAEGIPLAPDLVTFYEGLNEAAVPYLTWRAGLASRSPLLFSPLLDFSLIAERLRHQRKMDTRVPAEVIIDSIPRKRAEFTENLSRMEQLSRSNEVQFVVATQQAQSVTYPSGVLAQLTYADEIDKITDVLERTGSLTRTQATLYVHSYLMKDLEAWSERTGTPLVDGIGHLDQDRRVIKNWVHLNPTGTTRLAEAFAAEISKLACSTQGEHIIGKGLTQSGIDATPSHPSSTHP
jgi:lysophospholipase L1-like esterase